MCRKEKSTLHFRSTLSTLNVNMRSTLFHHKFNSRTTGKKKKILKEMKGKGLVMYLAEGYQVHTIYTL